MRRFRLTVALFAALAGLLLAARLRADAPPVVINEILPGNASTVLDPDYKNFVPWVELHNTGSTAVQLAGYRLTDDLGTPARWIIPTGVTIPPRGYRVLCLDAKPPGLPPPPALDRRAESGLSTP